jgi:hypothetical protein
MHLHLNAMPELTAPELIVPELTVLEDWSFVQSSMKSWKMTSRSQPMRNANSKTSRHHPRMILNRHRNRKMASQHCGLSHVARSQSRLRCAWGLHLDRRDAHFRRHHALAGFEHSADLFLEDTAVQDAFCVDTGRYPGPGSRGYRMTQCRHVELKNHSSEDCSGSGRIAAGRATGGVQFVVGFSGRDTAQRSCRWSVGTGPVHYPGVCAVY